MHSAAEFNYLELFETMSSDGNQCCKLILFVLLLLCHEVVYLLPFFFTWVVVKYILCDDCLQLLGRSIICCTFCMKIFINF